MPTNRITVLIPTRERADLLASAIESCLAQAYDNCAFIVSDNASRDHTRDVVNGFNDPRLIYVNPGRRLSMAENFEFALSHTSPGYVISIGDDDALMPDALLYLNDLVSETSADSIGGRWNCYFWDSFPVASVHNMLSLWLGDGYSVKSTSKEVRRALQFDYSYIHKLAGLYYGLISTALIDKLRYRGRFFQSITPDAYSAFACTLSCDSFVYSHKPFVLAGLSGKSNGVSQMLSINPSEANQFLQENAHAFHDALVYCPAEAVIMAEAYFQLEGCHPNLTSAYPLSIERMCVVALRQAAPNVRTQVEGAVMAIAQRYRLDFRRMQRRSKIPPIISRLRKEVDELRYPRYMLPCPPSEPRNIARAAQYAAAIAIQNMRRPYSTWASHQMYRISRRLSANASN